MCRVLVLPILFFTAVFAEDLVHNPIQYHSQTPRGSYNYGYDTGLYGSHSFHQENRNANGQVRGRYGYTDPDGNLRLTYYTAGPQGFNVIKDTPAPAPAPVPVPAYRTHSDVTHHDDRPVIEVSSHSRPVSAPCKYRDPPCTQKTLQHVDQHVDDKVSVSYSTSSKSSHQEKQSIIVQPGSKEVIHHTTEEHVNKPIAPVEHRHHHLHHRNHDAHEGIIRVPAAPVAVPVSHTHVEAAVQSSPLVVHEKTTHHQSNVVAIPVAPVKTLEHHVVHPPVKTVEQHVVHHPVKTVEQHHVVHQPIIHPPVKTVEQHHVVHQPIIHPPVETIIHPPTKTFVHPHPIKTVVHPPVKTVQHQDVVIEETIRPPPPPPVKTLVETVHKTHYSPVQQLRRTEHRDQVVIESTKSRYAPHFKPSSRCYCV